MTISPNLARRVCVLQNLTTAGVCSRLTLCLSSDISLRRRSISTHRSEPEFRGARKTVDLRRSFLENTSAYKRTMTHRTLDAQSELPREMSFMIPLILPGWASLVNIAFFVAPDRRGAHPRQKGARSQRASLASMCPGNAEPDVRSRVRTKARVSRLLLEKG